MGDMMNVIKEKIVASLNVVKTLFVKKEKNSSKKKNNFRNSRSFLKFEMKVIVLSLMVIIPIIETVFAINVYAFKSKDNITRYVSKAIPYPAVFTMSGISTVSDYWMEKDYIEHFYDSTKQTGFNEDDLSKQILMQEAENVIIKRESIAYKVSVSQTEVDEAMSQIYEGNGGTEEVEKALKDLYGLSISEFKRLVKTQLLRDKINKDVIERVTARHILIRVEEGATEEVIQEAKNRIDSYVNEIKAGLSFEEAANKYSEDVGSNQDGGLLEAFARGDMVEEFEKVAFSTPIGEISEPFRTSFGWHILKSESKTGYVDKSFETWVSDLIDQNFVINLYKD